MCMEGDFAYSAENLLSPVNTPASRFTPHLFLLYLRIFKTGTAPKLMVTQPVQLCLSDAPWQPIKGPTQITCFYVRRLFKSADFLRGGPSCVRRGCATEAQFAGEVCSQGSEMLLCCLQWCKSAVFVGVLFTACLWMYECNINVCVYLSIFQCVTVMFVFQSQCWTSVLLLVNTPLPEPNLQFLLVRISSFFFYHV